ncbi:MAG: ABC transporter substrate-binding protein [Actinobacteria bacterium]|nr:ABC transporter substrate-binding protein [Actinomycetota bacterium]
MLGLILLAAACGGAAESEPEPDSAAQDTTSEPAGDEEPASEPAATASCDVDDLPLTTEGQLTVATGEPVFEPWMVDDDPTSGEGFESALVYALADELGFAEGDVEWVRTGFDQAIAPGPKDYDFNIQQYSITEERDEVVDFSDGYYEVEQALVAAEDSPVAEASSVDDLASARLGAAIGTTSLDYIEQVIQPESQAQVFDDNAAAKAAFDAGQVDGLVFDLPTAYFITAVEIPDASIVGVLPRESTADGASEAAGGAEELGMLFEEGSELVPCVNEALSALRDDGTLEALEEEWLSQSGDIPTLTP